VETCVPEENIRKYYSMPTMSWHGQKTALSRSAQMGVCQLVITTSIPKQILEVANAIKVGSKISEQT